MAIKRNALVGALVPVAGPDGGVAWQSWTYGELTQHLTNDLSLDDFAPPSSLSWTPRWTAPVLINGWALAFGAGIADAGYLKDPLRFVRSRGRVFAGASGSVAFVFPVGFRPSNSGDTYPLVAFNGVTPTAGGATIDSLGNVRLYYAAGTTDLGLSGLSFLAEL